MGQSYFKSDGAQIYLIPQPLFCTLKKLCDTEKNIYIYICISWKSKILPYGKPTTPTTSVLSRTYWFIYYHKLAFKHHIDNTLYKVNKGIAVIKKRRHALARKCLLTIYKACLRPLIDHRDIIYDQTYSSCFCEQLELAQCKVTLAIAGAIRVLLV